MDIILLPPHLAAIAGIASDQPWDAHKPLGAVLVERLDATDLHPHGRVRVVASDRRRLVEAIVPLDDPEEFPAIPALEAAPNTATRALVDAGSWRTALRGAPKRVSTPILRNVAARLSEKEVTFASTDGERTTVTPTKAVEGEFPDHAAVWPSSRPKAAVTLSLPLLKGLLAVIEGFAPASEAVRIEVRGEGDPVVFLTASPERGRVEALLMPLTLDGKLRIAPGTRHGWRPSAMKEESASGTAAR